MRERQLAGEHKGINNHLIIRSSWRRGMCHVACDSAAVRRLTKIVCNGLEWQAELRLLQTCADYLKKNKLKLEYA